MSKPFTIGGLMKTQTAPLPKGAKTLGTLRLKRASLSKVKLGSGV
jgi:hypothetical protein